MRLDENGQAAARVGEGEAGLVALEAILAVVWERRGIDFRRYRRPTIERRVRNRMLQVRAETYEEYLPHVLSDTGEVDRLIERLTIKVSRFYRDAAVFDRIATDVLPQLVERGAGRPLRLWSAGCGNGEEAYTLALLLAEAERIGAYHPALVCATDIDPTALAMARRGCYREEALEELPALLADRYLVRESAPGGALFRVRDPLRVRVHFQVHDLSRLAPPPGGGGFDLICCRNVLIYLGQEWRHPAQCLLRDALLPGGYLCLGEAEWLLNELTNDFEVIDRRARLFQRRP